MTPTQRLESNIVARSQPKKADTGLNPRSTLGLLTRAQAAAALGVAEDTLSNVASKTNRTHEPNKILLSAEPKLIAYFHDLTISKMDFNVLRPANWNAVFIPQCGDQFLGFDIKYIGSMRPSVQAI